MNTDGPDPAGAEVLLETERGSEMPRVFQDQSLKPDKTRPVTLRRAQRYDLELSRGTSDRSMLALG